MVWIGRSSLPSISNCQRGLSADLLAVSASKTPSVSSLQPCPRTQISGKSELRAFFKAFVNSLDAASPEDERCWGDSTPFDVK